MKSNKLIRNLIFILLITIISLGSVFLENLSKNYFRNQYNNVINTDILYKIGESNYALYHSLTKKREGNKVKPSDYLINENSIMEGK